jgi:hypothetical protein
MYEDYVSEHGLLIDTTLSRMRIYSNVCVCVFIYTCVRIYIYIYIHVCMYIHTYGLCMKISERTWPADGYYIRKPYLYIHMHALSESRLHTRT